MLLHVTQPKVCKVTSIYNNTSFADKEAIYRLMYLEDVVLLLWAIKDIYNQNGIK